MRPSSISKSKKLTMQISQTQEQPRLPTHEWITVLVILFLLATLTGVVLASSNSIGTRELGTPHYIVDREIEVFIEGAVEKPGAYKIERGACVSDLLALASIAPDADTRKLKLDKKLRKGQVIKIPHRPMITVHVEGAVKTPGAILVPKGSVVSDLASRLDLLEEADGKSLRRKRRLKDGEVIKIKTK
ncbi:MAG: SLBB domain-containing protein [Parachlamydiaceae bacterium]|nr:SLBB domain-containing protein [Parachlamydiaceae bacterium]